MRGHVTVSESLWDFGSGHLGAAEGLLFPLASFILLSGFLATWAIVRVASSPLIIRSEYPDF